MCYEWDKFIPMQSESASDTTQSDDSLQSDKLSGNESDSQVEVC